LADVTNARYKDQILPRYQFYKFIYIKQILTGAGVQVQIRCRQALSTTLLVSHRLESIDADVMLSCGTVASLLDSSA
jgi:hypothetical protein